MPDINIIVGGHSQNRLSRAIQVGSTLIVQAGAHLSDVGELKMQLHDGKVVSFERHLIALEHETVPPNPAIAQRIAELRRPFADQLDEQLGEAEGPIIRAQTFAGQETRERR